MVNIPTVGDQLHLNINTGINIKKKLSERSNLVLGIRKSWGVKIGKGSLMVQMYDQFYYGTFNTRANYIGLDLMFKYDLANMSEKLNKQKKPISDTLKVRKAFFIEFLGNGGCLTGNFDIRLNPGHNDGLGLRAGLGSGYLYSTRTEIHRYLSVPIGLNYIIGKRRSGFESGIGVTTQFAPRKTMGDPQISAEHI